MSAKSVTYNSQNYADTLGSGLPVVYASRALIDPETRYTQIEKELLAVVFAFTRFHQYVYGKEVKVESDITSLWKTLQKTHCQQHRLAYRECFYNYKGTHLH